MEGEFDPFLTPAADEEVANHQQQQPLQIDCTEILDSLRGEFDKRAEEQQIQKNKQTNNFSHFTGQKVG